MKNLKNGLNKNQEETTETYIKLIKEIYMTRHTPPKIIPRIPDNVCNSIPQSSSGLSISSAFNDTASIPSNFVCKNNTLTSLHEAPKVIGGNFKADLASIELPQQKAARTPTNRALLDHYLKRMARKR